MTIISPSPLNQWLLKEEVTVNEVNNSPKPATRSAWIEARVAELLANGWKSPELAAKRATREWKTHSPQHQAAAWRNHEARVARSERLNDLHPADAVRLIVDGGMVVLS